MCATILLGNVQRIAHQGKPLSKKRKSYNLLMLSESPEKLRKDVGQ